MLTMNTIVIQSNLLSERVTCPPSKSHTLRAILFASLAEGVSLIQNPLVSPDTVAMIKACKALGADIEEMGGVLRISGRQKTKLQSRFIDAGNSGQVLRFVAAVSALSGDYVELTGDHSVQTRRICLPLLEALKQRGAFASSLNGNGRAPIAIQGPIQPGEIEMDGQDSQPVSAMLIACSLLPGMSCIRIKNAGETPWLALTLDWLKRLNVRYETIGWQQISIWGQSAFPSFEYSVPGDLSSVAFPLVAALCTQSDIVVENVDLDDVQGDKIIIDILRQMGARFIVDKVQKTVAVKGPQKLKGCKIDVNDCIDALPVLAVVGCFAEGRTTIYNGAVARYKESNRIEAIVKELAKMGAKIEETTDGLFVDHSLLKGACVYSHEDHRIALSLTVAALGASGESKIEGVSCVDKSYPTFFTDLLY